MLDITNKRMNASRFLAADLNQNQQKLPHKCMKYHFINFFSELLNKSTLQTQSFQMIHLIHQGKHSNV